MSKTSASDDTVDYAHPSRRIGEQNLWGSFLKQTVLDATSNASLKTPSRDIIEARSWLTDDRFTETRYHVDQFLNLPLGTIELMGIKLQSIDWIRPEKLRAIAKPKGGQ